MPEIIFYAFSVMLIAGATFVIFANNPVKAVLSLVFAFLNAAALLLMTGAEFISAILIIVYVGAVVVLFLFVVMTLSTQEQNKSFRFTFIPFIVFIVFSFLSAFETLNVKVLTFNPVMTNVENTQSIGMKLYTEYFLQFQLAGIILLVALVGVIVLSQREKLDDIKKQNVWKQITTDPKDRIKVIPKETGIITKQ
jgi:NADH-quinone oxidoreductase subunit J